MCVKLKCFELKRNRQKGRRSEKLTAKSVGKFGSERYNMM